MDPTSLSTFSTKASMSSESNINSSSEFDDFIEITLLPTELTQIRNGSLACVIAYCIVFLIAICGNFRILLTLWQQYKTKRKRISLLLLHLSLADLIVCCTLIPTEIIWRLTIQWHGGNVLCKVVQSLCAFGLYLSSLILICVSFDRFLAIVFPLNGIKCKPARRNKWMLTIAWISAAIFAAPQAIFWGIESHPEYPSFKQCVTNNFLNDPSDVKIYSVFSVAIMYFVPLLVIFCTYSAISWKLYRKSVKGSDGSRYSSVRVSQLRANSSVLSKNTSEKNKQSEAMELRCSASVGTNMSKAKTRTLQMTVIIIFAFVICWTPYASMTLWYMVDWKGAAEVDIRIQDALFLMAVANSCVNPFIYRIFMRKSDKHKLGCCSV